ncbi:hypothetical protein M406DRAFT_103927 [Cryphonectria parasitica EP155]|uniref:Uncharacterized protein n=1 Tax=Cryphonectria parasitica (strain ATCC 38755 / EP155) TaxID=660469 RepID=A0A9P4XV05_CRYP1|nr:uncharacterized protein M406DRAFT_103927 [Cryphonectria parasitica EP155]KAF3761337.1 hypothetical protein M406DRAFT_103927 [Cryphonectria parasitica EP155]
MCATSLGTNGVQGDGGSVRRPSRKKALAFDILTGIFILIYLSATPTLLFFFFFIGNYHTGTENLVLEEGSGAGEQRAWGAVDADDRVGNGNCVTRVHIIEECDLRRAPALERMHGSRKYLLVPFCCMYTT